jgi:L-asparaginase/N4-(beta-N-acetylglucosaminyl)-L-asparaginase
MVVELMRNGNSPQQACKIMVERILKLYPDRENLQVGFLALNKSGEYGAYGIQKGFNFAIKTNEKEELEDALYLI